MAVDARVGSQIGGYRIDRLLGRGGMSSVYLAEHLRLHRKVTLKFLAPELAEDARFRERFLRESQLASSLDHPNIVPIYDADEVDGTLYIAMRWVEGIDLRELLRRERPLDASCDARAGGDQRQGRPRDDLADWADVLVAEEPTAGIDVGTRAAIYERLAQAAADGASVLLMSSDADEVAAIADRAIVFAHGAPKAELRRSELSPARIAKECFSG